MKVSEIPLSCIPRPSLMDAIVRELMLALYGRGEVADLRAFKNNFSAAQEERQRTARESANKRWNEDEEHQLVTHLMREELAKIVERDPTLKAYKTKRGPNRGKFIPGRLATAIVDGVAERNEIGSDAAPHPRRVLRLLEEIGLA